MNKEAIIKRVMSKISFRSPDLEDERSQDEQDAAKDNFMDKQVQKVKSLAQKYKKLNKENAISYAREVQSYHGFDIPKEPKTEQVVENGADVIYVEVKGEPQVKNWYPVWLDKGLGGLYGEY